MMYRRWGTCISQNDLGGKEMPILTCSEWIVHQGTLEGRKTHLGLTKEERRGASGGRNLIAAILVCRGGERHFAPK